jgi:hypothetical protein
MSHQFFGISSVVLSLAAFFPYFISIIKGKTKPSGASWWTWTVLAGVAVISSYAAGAPWQVLILPAWLFFSQAIVAILSIKRGDNNWDLINKVSVSSAIIGIIVWWLTGQPLIALAISIIADIFASVPNWRHTWRNPEQENRLGWTLGWGSAVLEIFAINTWSLAESGWAIYFLLGMTLTLFLVWRPIIKKII